LGEEVQENATCSPAVSWRVVALALVAVRFRIEPASAKTTAYGAWALLTFSSHLSGRIHFGSDDTRVIVRDTALTQSRRCCTGAEMLICIVGSAPSTSWGAEREI
jgi:hypothetical protein